MPKVVVIGGGPAGMMAAITAAENGNEVLIIEKFINKCYHLINSDNESFHNRG